MARNTAEKPVITAVLCVGSRPDTWLAAIKSLRDCGVSIIALVEPSAVVPTAFLESVVLSEGSLADAVSAAVLDGAEAVLVAHSPVVVPPEAFTPGLDLLRRDIRIATVSFWSNSASYLSYPQRNAPGPLPPNGHNERTITAALRRDGSAAHGLGATEVPIAVPAGAAVLLASTALRAVGGLNPGAPTAELAILDFSLLASRRGFANMLDPLTYVTRPGVPASQPLVEAIDEDSTRAWLAARHFPEFPTLFDDEHVSDIAPVAQALAAARSAVFGLTIAFDGSALGRYQMGTQVAILGQLEGLVEDRRVEHVFVGTPNGTVPDYAQRVLNHPKITVVNEDGGQFPKIPHVDILHRPFQPSGPLPFDRWHSLAYRIAITIQDLIAYDNGFYFASPKDFSSYRRDMVNAVGSSDAIIAISYDTARMIERARLPIPREAIYIIENGTDHLRPGDEVAVPPAEFIDSGLMSSRFLLVLGAAYAHKNRDLAIRAWQELRRRSNSIQLVLAGAIVPNGSSVNEEALAMMEGEAPLVLADITAGERDWLMKHAAAVFYPTSAEGFGLIPFEAAVFDTPAIAVDFGPLAELLPDVPVKAENWNPETLADAVERLINHPDVARAQVDAIKQVSSQLTWRRYADRLIDAYLEMIARPSVRTYQNHDKRRSW